MIEPLYRADDSRYENGMKYRRSGRSGILLPEISLGMWHNFGEVDPLAMKNLLITEYALSVID